MTDASRTNRILQIVVLVELDNSWGRNVVQGVGDFATNFGPWNLLIDPRDYSEGRSLPESWQGDGVIARISTPIHLEKLTSTGLPVVNVDDLFPDAPGMGYVLTDEAARAEMALGHFQQRGFQHFAFFAPPSHDYSRTREHAFVAAVESTGGKCHVYRPGYRVGRRIRREEEHNRTLRWLRSLPRPTAIMAVDARRARQLSEICSVEEIRVPDEFAILAGDNDDLLCNLSMPPLSSIKVASRRIGYDAAAMLLQMIRSNEAPAEPVQLPPICVIGKQSTDVLAIDDEMIIRAVRFIQAHAFQGIVVDDVLKEVPVSRRYLELQFRRYFGRLPAEEIRRLRLDRGKELLAQTDMSVDAVAEACGYAGATQFGVAFRKRFGATPLSFRKHLRQGDATGASAGSNA
ncbi:MAG: DNA-binding transcriptional regulator [Planctomycetales bacterium]|nr:DNA-binding transcriptional regulator [Planctomycetales bacterium]